MLAAAIDRVDPETVVVAAAGNHGDLEEETSFTRKELGGNEGRRDVEQLAARAGLIKD